MPARSLGSCEVLSSDDPKLWTTSVSGDLQAIKRGYRNAYIFLMETMLRVFKVKTRGEERLKGGWRREREVKDRESQSRALSTCQKRQQRHSFPAVKFRTSITIDAWVCAAIPNVTSRAVPLALRIQVNNPGQGRARMVLEGQRSLRPFNSQRCSARRQKEHRSYIDT